MFSIELVQTRTGFDAAPLGVHQLLNIATMLIPGVRRRSVYGIFALEPLPVTGADSRLLTFDLL